MKIAYIESKTILNKSKLSADIDYTINPYVGCEFCCKYCYASYLSNLVKEDNDKWGEFVYVKKNCIDLLKKELGRMILNHKKPKIMLSSATDPYQYIEEKEQLTKQILETFIEFYFQGEVLCLTKSPLILRDIYLLKQIKNLTVALSICTNNDKVKNFFEPNTPSIQSRFKALKILNQNNLNTCVFVAPILPYYENHLDELELLFKQIKDAGTNKIVYDFLNLYGNMTRYKELFKNNKKAQEFYIDKVSNQNYLNKMDYEVQQLISKYNFEILK